MAEEAFARERGASMSLEDLVSGVDVDGVSRTSVRRDLNTVVGEGPGYNTPEIC